MFTGRGRDIDAFFLFFAVGIGATLKSGNVFYEACVLAWAQNPCQETVRAVRIRVLCAVLSVTLCLVLCLVLKYLDYTWAI